MKPDNGDLPPVEALIGQACNSDVPPEVERQMKSQLAVLRQRLEAREARSPSLWRKVLRPRWIGTAAAACLAATAFLLLHNGASTSVYAQAVLALEKARTVHAQLFCVADGVETVGAEVWYEAGRGVREWQRTMDGTVYERLDDGQYKWTYRSGTQTVIKTRGSNPLGPVAKILKLREDIDRKGFQRLPEADEAIDGAACLAYTSQDDPKQVRCMLWIDPQDRVRRFERQREKGGKWVADKRGRITYDQPLPQGRLVAEFGPGVAVVDLANAAAPLRLEQDLLRKEVLGQVLAVHELRRLDNGAALVTWSIRPTEETLRRLGPIADGPDGAAVKKYGDAQVGSSWKRLEGGGEKYVQPMDIATWTHDGVRTTWTVLIPKGVWTRPVAALDLQFSVYSRNELQKEFERAGRPRYDQKCDLGTLALPENAVTLDAACLEVYSHIAWAGNHFGTHSASLTGLTRPLTDEEKQDAIRSGVTTPDQTEHMSTTPMCYPDSTTPQEFVEAVRANYERLLK